MPKQSGLVTDAERAICARLKLFRERGRWPRNKFADRLGITEPKLVSIESGLTPLRYGVASLAAQRFNLNLRWLATNTPPESPAIQIPDYLATKANTSALFSTVYADTLATHFEGAMHSIRTVQRLREELGQLIAGDDPYPEIDSPISAVIPLPEWVPSLECELEILQRYAARLRRMIEQREFAIRASRDIHGPPSTGVAKSLPVDTFQEIEDTPAVSLTWNQLKSRLKAAGAIPGNKAAMARAAKVNQSSVNSWLDDDREPGAEATFRLLEWVTAEEAKQKSAAAAETAAAPKTQKDHTYESSKSKSSRTKT